MKVIVSFGVILLVIFGIFVMLAISQRESMDNLIKEDSTGFWLEKKKNGEAARGDKPEKIFPPPVVVRGPSWLDPIQNAAEDCWRAIKNLPTSLGHRVHLQRPAAAKDIAGPVPVLTPTTFQEGQFVTLVSPVSIQTAQRKTINLHAGSNVALLAIENGQAVIRYYDGRKYSIPLSATDYR